MEDVPCWEYPEESGGGPWNRVLPKVACDTTVCEVARILRLESDKVVPISFQCPRKVCCLLVTMVPCLAVENYQTAKKISLLGIGICMCSIFGFFLNHFNF